MKLGHRGRRRLLSAIAGFVLTFLIVVVGYFIWDATIGISTGARLPEALSVGFFAAIGGTLLGLLFSAVRDDGEDHEADERARRGRRGTASRTP
jgi:membrane associated rhomboid family serine protease